MKNTILLILVCSIFSANILFSQQDFQGISGINTDNYPLIDGSTSTNPLNYIVAAKLLDLEYEWTSGMMGDARKMSADERQYANDASVSLIETPIALDALDFIINTENSVNSLSVEQIQNIYLGNITNWSEVGGANEAIIPFIRNANSGSQEMMNEIVMSNAGMPDWEVSYWDELTIWSMFIVYWELWQNKYGICFTPHYYKEYMAYVMNTIKTIAINEIMPDKNSIENKTYPFVANVYVSIRSDLDHNSMAYKLYEWLQTPSGRSVIEESGYVPYENSESNIIEQINNQYIHISPKLTEGIIEIGGIENYNNLNYIVYNSLGQTIQRGKLKQTIDLSDRKGLNILIIMQNQKIVAREKVIVK